MEHMVEDIRELKGEVKELDNRVTDIEMKQVKSDSLYERVVESQNELSKSNKLLVETLTDVKFTMVEMKHSIENSNKEIVDMKKDISNIKDTVQEEKQSRMIDCNEVVKEDAKKKLSPVTKGALYGVGGTGVILALIEVIKMLIETLGK